MRLTISRAIDGTGSGKRPLTGQAGQPATGGETAVNTGQAGQPATGGETAVNTGQQLLLCEQHPHTTMCENSPNSRSVCIYN